VNNEKSQGSVATLLTCGGLFNYDFTRNLPLSLPVKECLQSVNIFGEVTSKKSDCLTCHASGHCPA